MTQWIWQQPDWPSFRWQAERLTVPLARARLAQGRVSGAAALLDGELTLEALSSLLVEEGVKTSAIEGERLDVDAVRSSVARHLGLPTAGLPTPSRSVDGVVEILLDASGHPDRPFTLERLCGWHAALFPSGFSGLRTERPGELRGEASMEVVSGPIGRERVHFRAPSRDGLEGELSRFVGWFNAPPEESDGLLLAGLAHLWFITLHPFEDGNGRLARAIADLAIARDEGRPTRLFSLSARILAERDAYYAILERTQRGELDVTEWLAWFLEQVTGAAADAQAILARTLAKARFWLRFQQTALNERQRKILNRLLDAGPGGFEGGMSNRKYASLAKTSRATAYRELADLVEKGCLVPSGKGGRSSAYGIPRDTLSP